MYKYVLIKYAKFLTLRYLLVHKKRRTECSRTRGTNTEVKYLVYSVSVGKAYLSEVRHLSENEYFSFFSAFFLAPRYKQENKDIIYYSSL